MPALFCLRPMYSTSNCTTPSPSSRSSKACRSARCTATVRLPNFSSSCDTGIVERTSFRHVRISALPTGPPISRSAWARPNSFKAAVALAVRERPAPTSFNSRARSKTTVSIPAFRSAIAAESPPIPAPITIAFTQDTFRSTKDHKIDHSAVQATPGMRMFVASRSDGLVKSSQ